MGIIMLDLMTVDTEEALDRIRELYIDSLISFEEVLVNLQRMENRIEQGILEESDEIVVRGEEHNQEMLPLVTLTERYADSFMEELKLLLDIDDED
jgi:hypothetical protein